MTEAPPLAALIGEGAARLRERGVVEPRREAVRIWADLAGLPTYALPAAALAPDAAAVRRFRHAIERRAAGEPLAYVTGVAGFRRLTLRSDPRALIPRPETEGLVELVLAQAPTGAVADVGTGTGCIALALADEGRYRLVLGIDRSREALGLAAENRARTGLPVVFAAGDLLEPVGPATLDAIVSNPPYLTEAEFRDLDPSVRAHEPRAALASGEDGLADTRRLLGQAGRVLRPGGLVALEIDATRAAASLALAVAADLAMATVRDDLFGRARYLLARRSEHT
ncbi:MAG TPA: peptide chain release factor N(5)-glutamine methyltransferase [Gemmatimonadales bacterium]|nr:peptide chain release factor N(5)-glutamine methyltransferase [Gemmatimonadales bacterium]